jgi:hypothetical protein
MIARLSALIRALQPAAAIPVPGTAVAFPFNYTGSRHQVLQLSSG